MSWTDAVTPLLGGLMIGLSAAASILLLGRIAGISGILGGALGTGVESHWRRAFVVGLPLGALFMTRLTQVDEVVITGSPLLLVSAGLLVGLGTRIGNGCTSGHGVCGLARGSRRSITATVIFMGTAALTVWIVRQFS